MIALDRWSRLAARRWRGWFVAVLALACVLLVAVASGAQAYVYWANSSAGSIGRANLDGSGINQSFITGLPTPWQVAVDPAHVYWTNGSSIGRANLDGSGKNVNFIQGLSALAGGLAVTDRGVYWTNYATGSIGRANLDGSGVNQNFITGAPGPGEVAIVRLPDTRQLDTGYMFWTSFPGTSSAGSIGSANLDGTNVNPSLITTAANSIPEGVAVDRYGKVYWANRGLVGGGSIGRANWDGSGVNQDFITGASQPEAVASDGAHVYWVNHGSNSIGRANADGSGVNQSFITGATSPWGVAVDAGGAPQITDVTQSASSWRAGGALPRTARAKPPVGTIFGFTLDRAARVQFLFTYRTIGRRVGGKCVLQTTQNRNMRRCLRTVRAAFSRPAHAGRTRLRFQGRLTHKRTLPSGRYKLLITATANGHRSKPAILRFTILPTTSRRTL